MSSQTINQLLIIITMAISINQRVIPHAKFKGLQELNE